MTSLLFPEDTADLYQPLAARVRPSTVDEFIGQQHLLSPGKSIREAIDKQQPHSMILWGPPGVAKLLWPVSSQRPATVISNHSLRCWQASKKFAPPLSRPNTIRLTVQKRQFSLLTRCIALTRRSRMLFCHTSKTAQCSSLAQPQRTRHSN